MSGQPIDIHYAKMEEWLMDRKSVLGKKHQNEIDMCLQLAPRLVQAVRYDIPALKKQLQKLRNQQEELSQTLMDNPKNIQSLKEKKKQFLIAEGVDPSRLEGRSSTEDMSFGSDYLAEVLDEHIAEAEAHVVKRLKSDVPVILPQCFAAYNRRLSKVEFRNTMGNDFASQHYPWLQRLSVEVDALPDCSTVAVQGTSCVAHDSDEPVADIDWGDDEAATVPAVEAAALAVDPAVEIRWDDDVDDGTELPPTSSSGVDGDDKDTIGLPPALLSNGGGATIHVSRAEHRTSILEELRALRAFMEECVMDHLTVCELPLTIENRRQHCAALHDNSEKLRALTSLLSEGPISTLLRMRNNFRLKQNMLDRHDMLCRSITATMARGTAALNKISSMDMEIKAVEPQLSALIATVKHQQKECETCLQRMFPDRPVSIVGDINSL